MSGEDLALLVEDLWVRLGGREVLKGVSLKVHRGEFWAIMGPNGAGKTTLIKALAGLLKPYRGRVLVFGGRKGEGSIGYVPQTWSIDLNFPLSLFEFVSMGLFGLIRPFGPLNASLRDKVFQVIERVGLSGLEGRPIGALSGGQLQRAFIGRALVSDPEILLLDEPTTGIDATGVGTIYELLGELNAEGKTLMVVTHDVGVVFERVSGVACMSDGRLVAHGRPPEVASSLLSCAYGPGSVFFGHGEVPHMIVERHK